MKQPLEYAPRLMGAEAAARHLGVSKTKFLSLEIPRKRLDGRVLYDRYDLDQFADDLPYEGGNHGGNTCDRAFGT